MGTVFIEGILLGLTLATFFGFGPAFFALVQTSIHRGFGPAVLLAIGIFINDFVMVLLCLMGAIQIVTEPSNYLWFGVASGIILMIFGLVTFNRKVITEVNENQELPINVKGPRWFIYIAKGFFMNIVNPFVWIFWIGVVVGISARFGGSEKELTYFFAGTLITVLASDIGKAYAAFSIKHYLNQRVIGLFNKIAGIGLISFGIFLIGKVLFEHLIG